MVCPVPMPERNESMILASLTPTIGSKIVTPLERSPTLFFYEATSTALLLKPHSDTKAAESLGVDFDICLFVYPERASIERTLFEGIVGEWQRSRAKGRLGSTVSGSVSTLSWELQFQRIL